MVATDRAPRLLGAMFLVVVATSLVSGLLLSTATGTGDTAQILPSVASHVSILQVSLIGNLLTSVGVIALAALLYIVLRGVDRTIALVAFGCWMVEAIVLAVSTVGQAALIPLSQSPAPDTSLAAFLYNGVVVGLGQTIHMFFYCVGGLGWYYLFFSSRYIPRVISLYGLVAVAIALVGIIAQIVGNSVPIFVFLPILPFELAIGGWLVWKGVDVKPATVLRREGKPWPV